MIADLDYDNREVEFEEFLAAIIDKLGDKVLFLIRKLKKVSIKFLTSLMRMEAIQSI
jgi:hypothetical protein